VLYVYEAQMSMLIRIAQTRHGAERLQELQLLSILAQAEFIDARPEDSAIYAGKRTSAFS
jgi:nuclear pore complex protein Nup205